VGVWIQIAIFKHAALVQLNTTDAVIRQHGTNEVC